MTACGATVAGLAIAATVSAASALVLAVASGAGLLYSGLFKRSWLSWLPYAIAYPLVPLWVWVSLGEFRPHLLVLFPASVPVCVGIHLCNQLRDYDDDAELGMRGFAQLLGKKTAGTVCLTLLIVGPLVGLLFPLQGGFRAEAMLGGVIMFHWFVIGRCVARDDGQRSTRLWKHLFPSLQASAPLLLTTWLVTFSL
jgi:4-hydroxybenzoate polyprenyltransferase